MSHRYFSLVAIALAILSMPALRAENSVTPDSFRNEPRSSLGVFSDFYSYGGRGDSPTTNLAGGSVEYARQSDEGATWSYAFTVLGGSSDTASSGSRTSDYTMAKIDSSEVRFSTMYGSPTVRWLALGFGYTHGREDVAFTSVAVYKHLIDVGTPGRPNIQWDGTYYSKVLSSASSTGTSSEFLLKSAFLTPIVHLHNGTHGSLYLAPRADVETGYVVISGGNSTPTYILTANASLVYEWRGGRVTLTGGYRHHGFTKNSDGNTEGGFGRLGYSYRW
jgi:hypothetical protein